MRNIFVGLVIILAAISILFTVANRPIQAQMTGSDAEISKKLDDILKGQQQLLEAIASVKEELNIIKIRVTK